jgi:murein endopeptidase
LSIGPPQIMELRTILVLLVLPFAGGLGRRDPTPVEAALPPIVEPERAPASWPFVPDAQMPDEPPPLEPPASAADLSEIRWTIGHAADLETVAVAWGVRTEHLRLLNPELPAEARLQPGTQLVVYRADRRHPTRSVGAVNRGHLRNGMPLPEGPHWRLRDHRPRAYGSRNTIEALLHAFAVYGARYPDGPPVHLGEISRRTGGRVEPHTSHRSGRDVDIGYVHKSRAPQDRHFKIAKPKTIDGERTWYLVKALLATGEVQNIFMNYKLQRVVARWAAKELPRAEVERLFQSEHPDPSVETVISHETGHRDHMHVRFRCEEGNRRCLERIAKKR